MMQRLGFKKQISFGMPLIVLLSLGTSGLASFAFTAKIVRDLIERDLQSRIESVRAAVEVSYEDSMSRQKVLMGNWGPRMAARLRVHETKTENWTAENQVTHEKVELTVPSMLLDNELLSAHADVVDRIGEDSGEATTIFTRIPQGFLRTATNLKKSDGKRATGTYVPETSPVFKALEAGQSFLGRAQVLGRWYITSYEPIRQDGRTVGAFFMGTPETASTRIAEFLKKQRLLETGYFYIMGDEGTMIMHPSLEGKNVIKTADLDGRFIFKEIIDGKDGLINYHWLNAETKQTQDKIGVFRTFPELGWHVVASLNRAEAEASVRDLRWILGLIGIAMTCLMACVTWFFGRQVSRKLMQVTEDLSQTSRSTLDSAKALEGSAGSISDSVGRESSSLHETMSALEEVRQTTATNQDATQRASQLSTEMSGRAEEGKAVLERLATAIDHIATGNRETGQGLLKSFEEISSIVQVIAGIEAKTRVINDIVFQTKLLSFNASVEAARAGEHGKGFAVVADEVGRLSAQSGSAADEIRRSLEESGQQVVAIIARAKEQMAETTRRSERSTSEGVQVTAACQTTFEGLLGQISAINEAVHRINVASSEQARGVEEIAKAMQMIESATHENTKVAEETKELSETLTGNADHMTESVLELTSFVAGRGKNAA